MPRCMPYAHTSCNLALKALQVSQVASAHHGMTMQELLFSRACCEETRRVPCCCLDLVAGAVHDLMA